jgi:molybdopterin synthase catalytic subunit
MHQTKIATTPLSLQAAFEFIASPDHGGSTYFVGSIRQNNLGKKVLGVSYDVFEPLAENIFARLCQQAEEKWGPLKIYITHFKGRLNVGELAVIVAVSSPHRDEAFQACRFLIEAIKHECPIWKQEHYEGGSSDWVKGHAVCQH